MVTAQELERLRQAARLANKAYDAARKTYKRQQKDHAKATQRQPNAV